MRLIKRYMDEVMQFIMWTTLIILVCSCSTVCAISCVQCETTYNNKDCISSPPVPKNCTTCKLMGNQTDECLIYDNYEACTIVKTFNQNRSLIELSRGCFPYSTPYSCDTGTRDRQPVRICMGTCPEDGCNSARSHTWSATGVGLTLALLLYSSST